MSLSRKIILSLAALFLVVLAAATYISFFASYSEGYRVGHIIKLSKKGYIFKTWEGTLDQGVFAPQGQDGLSPRLWDFSVLDSNAEVRAAIDRSLTKNGRIKLFYKEKYFRWAWLGETKYFIDGVEELDGAAAVNVPAPTASPSSNPLKNQ